jgi:hypothetical protein
MVVLLGSTTRWRGDLGLGKNLKSFSRVASPNLVCISPNLKPMQFLGPSPNGKYVKGTTLFSLLKRSGSNSKGSGKYSGSRWSPKTETMTGVPSSITASLPGTLYCLTHCRLSIATGGYFLRVSERRKLAEEDRRRFQGVPLTTLSM